MRHVGVSNYGLALRRGRARRAGRLQPGVRARNLLFSEENLRRAAPVLEALREVAAAATRW